MGRYSNYDFSKIKDLIIKLESLSDEEKNEILKDSNLQKSIISEFSQGKSDFYNYFRSLISEIGVDNFFECFDFAEIHKYFLETSKYDEYKLFVCLMENNNINKVLNYALTDDVLFEQIFKQQDQMYSIFANIEYNTLVSIIKKMEASNLKYSSFFIRSIEENTQINLLHENLKEETFWWMLPHLRKNATEYFFLNDSRALTAIEEKKVSVPNLIEKEIKISPDILYTDVFFDGLKSTSLVEFRRRINLLLDSNPNRYIIDKTNKYLDGLINSYNSDHDIFEQYKDLTLDNLYEGVEKSSDKYLLSMSTIHETYNIKDDKELRDFLKKETARKLTELIIDRLLNDNYHNVFLNIVELLEYNETLDTPLIEIEYIKIYCKILNFDNLQNKEKIEISNKLKNLNMNTKFYEHLEMYRSHAHNKIVSKLYKPNKLNEELSNEVKVYDLDSESFSMVVRGLNIFDRICNVKRGCYSVIDNNNISVFDNRTHYYGYYNVDPKKIMHVFESDAFSSEYKNIMINRIKNTEDLTMYNGYNEIQIINEKEGNKYKALYPDYLVVFDEVLDSDYEEAKRLNIPIVRIQTEKYKNGNLLPSHMLYTNVTDGYRYIENKSEEQRIREGNKRS